MAVNAKNKGSSFEREISKDLSEFFDMEKAFSRSAGSGNRFGGKNYKNLNVHNRQSSKAMLGDIQTPDSIDLIVECKFYASLPFHRVLSGDSKEVHNWLDQLLTDQETFYKVFKERLPVALFIKINRAGTFLVLRSKDVRTLYKRLKIPHNYFHYKGQGFIMAPWEKVKNSSRIRKHLLRKFKAKG